jgi:hypothetical protein
MDKFSHGLGNVLTLLLTPFLSSIAINLAFLASASAIA